MIRSKRFLADGEGSKVKRLSSLRTLLMSQTLGEVVERTRYIRVFRPKRLLLDSERLAIQRLGL